MKNNIVSSEQQSRKIPQHQNKQICVSDFQSYSRQFLKKKEHNELHIYITNCKINCFRPTTLVFSNLRTLSLDNNNLESIEPLSQMHFPHIRKILLYNNKIISIKSLAKLSEVPELMEISLSMNPLIDPYGQLSKCDLSSLKELRLYQTGKSGPINMCAKLNCFFLQQFGIQHPWQSPDLRNKLLRHLFRCGQ